LMVDQLVAEGVEVVFGTTASGRSPIVSEITARRTELRFAAVAHEQIAANMAVGFAQASGRPGIVYVAGAPGLTNTMSALYNAHHSRIPIVVLADQQDSQILNDDPPLSGHLVQLASGVSKFAVELKTAGEIARTTRRAFHEALTSPRGPVVISMPANILLNQSHGVIMAPAGTSPLGAADASFLRKAAEELLRAKKPCIVSGNEVSQYHARREVASLAEVLGCPVFVEPLPCGVNFSNRHAQYAGMLSLNLHEAHRALQEFDVVLLLGVQTRMAPRAQEPPLLSRETFVIQINLEAGLAGRSIACNLYANADIAESLSRMRAEIQLLSDSAWVGVATKRAKTTVDALASKKSVFEESLVPPNPNDDITIFWLTRLLDQWRPENSSIISDLAADAVQIEEVLSLQSSSAYISTSGGIAGYALAASIGAQMASPKTMMICLTSAQSFMHSPQALSTAAQFKLPLKFMVIRGPASAGIGYQRTHIHDRPNILKDDMDTENLAQVSGSLGAPAVRISKVGEIEAALKGWFKQKTPSLIEAVVTG
jgi:benzoylformate decarboxylase